MIPFCYYFSTRLLHEFNESEANHNPDYPKFYMVVSLVQAERPDLIKGWEKSLEDVNKIWMLQNRAFRIALLKYPRDMEAWQVETKQHFFKLKHNILRRLSEIQQIHYKNIVIPYMLDCAKIMGDKKDEFNENIVDWNNTIGVVKNAY